MCVIIKKYHQLKFYYDYRQKSMNKNLSFTSRDRKQDQVNLWAIQLASLVSAKNIEVF